MYTEVSGVKQKGDKARLIGAVIPDSAPHCLQFWYHLYGAHIGELNVYVQVNCFMNIQKVDLDLMKLGCSNIRGQSEFDHGYR